MDNSFNPYYAEITLSRISKEAYFPRTEYILNSQHIQDRAVNLCFHDFLPGTVQKIAFDQNNNQKVLFMYRIL